MKRARLILAVLLLVALGAAGCVTQSRNMSATGSSRPRSFALAVSVSGGLPPTPAQWAAIQAKFADALAARGWVLVTDVALADHILRVDFVPDPDDPENAGRATVIAVRDNPRATVPVYGTSPYPSAVGYSALGYPTWAYSGLYSGMLYGYGSSFNDGYSGWTAVTPVVTTRPPTTPPLRHPPQNRDDCPPDFGIKPVTGTIAGNFRDSPINDHPRPPPSDGGHRWRGGDQGDRSYARSGSTSSRSDNSQSQANSSNSQSSSQPSRSGTYSRSDYSRSDSSASRSGSSGSSSWRSDPSSSRSDNSSWRSNSSSGSSSGSSYSRSDHSYSRSDSGSGSYSSHSSGSSSSYSSPSYSSSSSSGSYSSPSSSSSSSGSSASTGTAASVSDSGRVTAER